MCGAKPPTANTILITAASGVCPSRQGDLPAINALQIKPQWIHLFQQKAAAAKNASLSSCSMN
jgi:hypothetical protein